jgi:hypothetical protein
MEVEQRSTHHAEGSPELDTARHAPRIACLRDELVAADEVVREPVAAEAELPRVTDLRSTRAAAPDLATPPFDHAGAEGVSWRQQRYARTHACPSHRTS